MQTIKNQLKGIVLALCNAAAAVLGREVAPVILMYHSFDTNGWKYGVAPGELEQQLIYLRQRRQLVPLQAMADWVVGKGELSHDAVAITIDDGYADTYEVFFPLAQKHQIPFTLFLTTDLSLQEKLGNVPRPTVEQLREMHKSGLMTLGLHGHSHKNFPEVLKEGSEAREIVASKNFLEETFAQPITAVAYPAGRANKAVFAYVAELGLKIGCTTYAGFVSASHDLLRLPRIGVDRATSMTLFKGRLQPGFTLYLKLVRLVT